MNIKTVFATVALSLVLLPGKADAAFDTYWICLKNDTNEKKTILVEDVDNYDWNGVNRPDHNWHGSTVNPGDRRCEIADVNWHANKIGFSFVINGRASAHKVRIESNEGRPKVWYVLVGQSASSSILRGVPGKPAARSADWEIGVHCWNGCGEFTITDVP